MANNDNVFIANPRAAGSFHRAVKGTALPADPITDLIAAYKDHGLVSENGFKNNITRSTTDHKAFGGDVVASSQDDYAEEWTVELLEHNNLEVLKTTFGEANVTTADGVTKVERNKSILPRSVYVVSVQGQDGGFIRTVLPNAQVTSVGEISYTHSGLAVYTLTLKCYAPVGGGSPSFELREDDEPGS